LPLKPERPHQTSQMAAADQPRPRPLLTALKTQYHDMPCRENKRRTI